MSLSKNIGQPSASQHSTGNGIGGSTTPLGGIGGL